MATDGECSSSSTMDSTAKIEAYKKSAELLAQGKRNMLCGEVPKAVNLFEEAVKLLVKECGELSRDCADAYFSCGSALLELGRMETNVLGTALEGVEVEEEKEEEESEQFEKPPGDDDILRHQLRDEVYEAMSEGKREKEDSTNCNDEKKNCNDEKKNDSEVKAEDVDTKNCDEKKVNEQTDVKDTITSTVDSHEEIATDKSNEVEGKKESSIEASEVAVEKKSSEEKSENKESSEELKEKDDSENANEVGSKEESKPQQDEKKVTKEDEVSSQTEDAAKVESSMDVDEKKEADIPDESEADDGVQEGEEPVEGDDAVEGDETAEVEDSNEEGEKEEDVPNFQLSWEYLDLARVIYLKSETKEDNLKAAECHIKLAEVSMETEQHSTAVDDLLSALKIQQKFLEPDDRLIAETHYQLGLAYSLGKEFKLSIEEYQLAISVIEARIASLKKLLEEKQDDIENKENQEANPELKKYADEIKELQDLIPEMKNKIEDTQAEENDIQKMKAMVIQDLCQSGTTKGFGSPTKKTEVPMDNNDVDENGEKKASDIAHLVRKKRKPDEDVVTSGQELKKIKQDENSPAKVNGEEVKINGDCEENMKTKENGSGDGVEQNGHDVPTSEVNGDLPKTNGVEAEPMAT